MIRQGKYTQKLTPVQKAKRYTKGRWLWFKGLSLPKKILLIAGPILAFMIIVPLATYAYFARDIADKDRLMNRNNTGVVLLDKDGEAFFSTGRAEQRDSLALDQISDETEQALIASEDKNFYDHSGFSIVSILGALYANISSSDATYGGSTITQQLAKNTLLSNERSYLRKFQELSVAIAIERTYEKDEILEMYLNSVYYGEGAFGIQEAAETYFNKSPADLTLAEGSMLVGLLPAPAAYSPINGDPELAKERQETVLSRMVDNNVISEEEKGAAFAQELAYAPVDTSSDSIAPHFAEMVLNELYEEYGEERVTRSGYQVRTTLDRELQQNMNENIANHIGFIQANGGSNASGIAIDPNSGEIRALVGSADWNNEEFGRVNMVTTPRQPGSSFKPLYYTEALAEGVITPATILEDEPTDFGGGYRPLNADRTFNGNITARNALARSLNIPAVKVMEQLGVDQAVAAAKRMGITTLDDTDYGLSLALGSAETPLVEMTNAYAAFANEGQQYEPTIIKQINNKYNDNIFRAEETPKEVMSTQASYLISNMLSDSDARAPTFGGSLSVPGKSAAVKTGTTDDSRDAWTIGYTPQITVGVWVGNNDNEAMLSGGAGMAGPIWVNTMSDALASVNDTSFEVPEGIVQRSVCFSNGGLASNPGVGAYSEYFIAGNLPTGSCDIESDQEREARERREREAEEEEERREREEEKAEREAEREEQQNADEEQPVDDEVPTDEEQPPADGGNQDTPPPDEQSTGFEPGRRIRLS